MRFAVEHVTRYTYSRAVFLEPHWIRLRPVSDRFQRLASFAMRIEPDPAGTTDLLDAEGNEVTRAWFTDLTRTLTVHTTVEADTFNANPFTYVVLEPITLPVSYREPDRTALARFLTDEVDPAVAAFARDVAAGAGGDAQAFVVDLARRINEQHTHEIREAGDPRPAGTTLGAGRGSCRDLTVLYMEACRSQGIAARFVSGYQEGTTDAPAGFMHAWAEVFLPNAGWRGFDPTNGIAAADRHLAVARAVAPKMAAPTDGTFRGTGASARFDIDLQVRVTSSDRDRAQPS